MLGPLVTKRAVFLQSSAEVTLLPGTAQADLFLLLINLRSAINGNKNKTFFLTYFGLLLKKQFLILRQVEDDLKRR